MQIREPKTFEEWREACRALLSADVSDVTFVAADSLFPSEPLPTGSSKYSVPKPFLDLAQKVAYHRDPARWGILYRALWRITHGERHLLDLASDDDVAWLQRAEKSVRRDIHKMHAFVRFRKVSHRPDPPPAPPLKGGEVFVAWHKPDHFIVRPASPFFARRFPNMHWTILTPHESVTWDLKLLTFGPGVPASEAPEPDTLEEMWTAYYRSTFNPARIKLDMMTKEMPRRHWATLPETAAIPAMLAEAPARVETMLKHMDGAKTSAADFLPNEITIPTLQAAAMRCEGCDLCRHATQTVFSEGPADAAIVLVGEQPGDQEDRAGRPFVGPAGKILDQALRDAGLDRGTLYLTNAVKHFKFTPKGDMRIHHKPTVREMNACRPWLAAELGVVQPRVIVLLGATATAQVLGRAFRFTDRRGEVVDSDFGPAIATFHPSALLRHPDPQRIEEMRTDLVRDLRRAREISS